MDGKAKDPASVISEGIQIGRDVLETERQRIEEERERFVNQRRADEEAMARHIAAQASLEAGRLKSLELHERQAVAWERIAAALEGWPR